MRYGKIGLFYDGTFHDAVSGSTREVVCPANGEVLAEVAFAGAEDVELVVQSAVRGFEAWRRLTVDQRKEWMLRLRDAILQDRERLLEALMRETGKNRGVAEDDFEKLQKGLAFFPDQMKNLAGDLIHDTEGDAEHRITYSPIGPVAAYLAWNFPLLNLGYKIGPALASGCSLIAKPSGLTPLTNLLVAEISEKIRFPAGVFNVVPGDNNGFGNGLSAHTAVAGLTMIGSFGTAKRVIAASATSIKHLSLELGGNAPFIVFEDGDLDAAADLLVTLKVANTGQICVSPNRIFVRESILDKFVGMLKERLASHKLGFPMEDESATVGPMISTGEADRVRDLIERSVSAGAKVVFGGPVELRDTFVEPHLLTNLDSDNPIFTEEVFGPVIPVYSFKTDDEVLELANRTDTGLASYVFTADQRRASRFSNELEFGEVMVNKAKWDIHLPHIGIKNSGLGMDCSKYSLLDYVHMKRVTVGL